MPDEWRRSILVPIYKNKGDIHSMAHKLNSPVISTTLNIPFILIDRYKYTSPLVKHLVRSKNIVEQLG